MTLVNVWREGGEACIVTDTAWVNEDGTVSHFDNKTFMAANWSAVIGVSGSGGYWNKMIKRFVDADPANLDALLKLLPRAARSFVRNSHKAGEAYPSCRLFLAAWCREEEAVRTFTCCASMAGQKPVLNEVLYSSSPGLHNGECAAIEAKMEARQPLSNSEIVEHCQRQRQCRKEPDEYGNISPHCTIGGHLQLIRVSKDDVSAELIHQWPEKIGEPIIPFATGKTLADPKSML